MTNGIFAQFTMLIAVTEPLVCPRARTTFTYLYQWSDFGTQ